MTPSILSQAFKESLTGRTLLSGPHRIHFSNLEDHPGVVLAAFQDGLMKADFRMRLRSPQTTGDEGTGSDALNDTEMEFPPLVFYKGSRRPMGAAPHWSWINEKGEGRLRIFQRVPPIYLDLNIDGFESAIESRAPRETGSRGRPNISNVWFGLITLLSADNPVSPHQLASMTGMTLRSAYRWCKEAQIHEWLLSTDTGGFRLSAKGVQEFTMVTEDRWPWLRERWTAFYGVLTMPESRLDDALANHRHFIGSGVVGLERLGVIAPVGTTPERTIYVTKDGMMDFTLAYKGGLSQKRDSNAQSEIFVVPENNPLWRVLESMNTVRFPIRDAVTILDCMNNPSSRIATAARLAWRKRCDEFQAMA